MVEVREQADSVHAGRNVDFVQGGRSYDDFQKRTFGSAITGAVAGAASLFGADFYARNKMRDFDSKVTSLTRTDLLNGASARAAGGIGAGLDSADIKLKHTLDLINSGEHKFPKFIYNIGGKGTFAMGVALAVGAAAAATYFTVAFLTKSDKYAENAPGNSAPSSGKQTAPEQTVENPAPAQPTKEWTKTVEPAAEETKAPATVGR